MDYWFTIISLVCINTILAWSCYASYVTGTVSLGQAGLFAVGAFASASLTSIYGWHIFPATVVGAIAAAVVGLGIAIPMLRLRGLYLTIATVAFVEVVRVVFHNLKLGREGEFAVDASSADAQQMPWIGPDGPLGFRTSAISPTTTSPPANMLSGSCSSSSRSGSTSGCWSGRGSDSPCARSRRTRSPRRGWASRTIS